MDEVWKNPYVAGAPIRGQEMFFGREEIFAWLRSHLIGRFQDNPIVLYGERRTGKTSILYQVHRRLEDSTYLPVFIDMQQLSLDTINSFLWQVATKIWGQVRRETDVSQLNRPQRDEFENAPGVYFEEMFLNQVQETIGNRKLLLMFDEFGRVQTKIQSGELPTALIDYLRSLMVDHRVSIVFSLGSKIEEMDPLFSVFFNPAIYHQITFLEEADTRALITRPVADYYTYQDAAIDLILRATSGHPFYTQHICHSIFAAREKGDRRPVTEAEVRQALPRVVEATAQNHKYVWDDIKLEDQAVLTALAALIDQVAGTVSEEQVRQLLQEKDMAPPRGEISVAIQNLRTRDVLREVSPDQYAFAVEPLHQWLTKERRLDYVRQRLEDAGVTQHWRQLGREESALRAAAPPAVTPDTLSIPESDPQLIPMTASRRPWWRHPWAVVTAVLLALGLGATLLGQGPAAGLFQPTVASPAVVAAPTETATLTPTPVTPSATASDTPTQTPTPTPIASDTPTQTPTPTVSPTPTNTATPTPIPPPVIVNFVAQPPEVAPGESVSIFWVVDRAETITIDPLPGGQRSSGVTTLPLLETTEFVLTAVNGPEIVDERLTVRVIPPPTAPPASPTLADLKGKIIFKTDRDGVGIQIYQMNPDGSGQRPIGRGTGQFGLYEEAESLEPYSPDRREWLTVRTDGAPEIWRFRAMDGLELRVTHHGAADYDPAWSPIDNRIVFTSDRTGQSDLYFLDMDQGGSPERLTMLDGNFEKHPTWSPDGRQIAFWSGSDSERQIWIIDLNTRELRNISHTPFRDFDPIWVK